MDADVVDSSLGRGCRRDSSNHRSQGHHHHRSHHDEQLREFAQTTSLHGVPRVIRGTAHARHQGFRASSAHGPWSLESSGRPSASERSSCSSATAPVSCTSTAPTRRRWLARVRRVSLVLVCSARPTVYYCSTCASCYSERSRVTQLSALLTKTDGLPSLTFVLCCACFRLVFVCPVSATFWLFLWQLMSDNG